MAFASPVTRDNVFFYVPTGGWDSSDNLYVNMPVPNRSHPERYHRADPSHLYNLLTYKDPGPKLTKKGTVAKRQPPPHKDESENFYLAQLLHYGLKPLKSKDAAKKALLAAFGTGTTLKVPEHILKMEKELEKEYAVEQKKVEKRYEEAERERERVAKEREAEAKKRHARMMADALGEATTGASNKRKAEEAVDGSPAKKTKANLAGTKLSELDTHGIFTIVAPSLTESWPDDAGGALSLKMSRSPGTGRHHWISFNFGIISGVMRCGASPTTAGTFCPFVWRGREAGEDQITFSDLNTGTITFLGDGKFKGIINGDLIGEGVEFVGRQQTKGVSDAAVWTKHVKGWKREWRGLSERMWNAECSGRWGGWVDREECAEGPADSDTTDGGEDRELDVERDAWEGYDEGDDDFNVAF